LVCPPLTPLTPCPCESFLAGSTSNQSKRYDTLFGRMTEPLLSPRGGTAAWAPLAGGDLRERAWETVLTVAAELEPLLPGAGAAGYPGLAGGDAGLAL